MSFKFGGTTTTSGSTFGTSTPSTGFAFGGGDQGKPSLFGSPGTGATDNKPAFNFTSPSGGFAFGAKTTAATTSLFTSPAATSASTAFSANKSLSFGAPPPNQTVGSPGFGQPQQQATQPQSTPFALGQQSTPAPAFGSPATQAATFGSTTPSFAFGKTETTTATPGFGFSTPATGFGAAQPTVLSAAAPATQTTQQSAFGGTPAFGQNTAFGAKPGGFSFSGNAAPATTAAATFGGANVPAQPRPSLGFGTSPAPPGGISSFDAAPAAASTAQSSFSFNPTSQANAFGTQPTSQPSLNFGSATSQPGFGTQPSSQPAQPAQPVLGFGTQPAAQPTGFGLGTQPTSQPAGLGFGTSTAQATSQAPIFSTPSTAAAQPTAGLSFGTTPATTANKPLTLTGGTLSLPASTAAPASSSLPGFGTSLASSTTQPTTGLPSFGVTPASSASQPALGFGTTPTSLPTAGLGFGTTQPATTGLTGFSAGTGLGFGIKTTAASTAASTTAPSGITVLGTLGKSTASTTMPSLTTVATTTAVAPPQQISSITFAELEENINKWTLELEEQEKTFINQATQVNAWDRLLIANGEKIVELNDAVETVKNEQQNLEHELDFVLAQQKELEDLLAPMEKHLLDNQGDRMRDPEREHMYSLAENLDSQLRQMSEDLKEIIEHLNETNRGQDSNDPIVQIGRILNTHMSSMQWVDNSIAQISNKLDQLKATHDTLRRDNERSFQLTYN